MEEHIFIFFITVGAVIFFGGLLNLYKALSRRRWPETIARIEKNEQTTIPTYPRAFFPNSGLISWYKLRPIEQSSAEKVLRLTYIYAVDGYKYIGNKLYSAALLNTRNKIFGLHEGDKVKVFYKPSDPKMAFLAHSYSWPSILLSCLGILIIGGCLYVEYMV